MREGEISQLETALPTCFAISRAMSGIGHFKSSCRDISAFPTSGGAQMRENLQKWMELCEQAATEQDPEKLMELISEINRLLEAKERRLKGNPSATEPAG